MKLGAMSSLLDKLEQEENKLDSVVSEKGLAREFCVSTWDGNFIGDFVDISG